MKQRDWTFLFIAFFFIESLFLFILSQIGAGHEVIVGDGREIYGYLLDFWGGRPLAPRPFPFGAILLWLPFFLLGKLLLIAAHALGLTLSAHAASLLLQILVAAGSSSYGLAGLCLLYTLLIKQTEKAHAFWITLFSLLTTPLLYYLFFEPCMSHVPAFFLSTLFLKKLDSSPEDPIDFLVLGVGLGVLTLTRTLDAFYGLLVLPFWIRQRFSWQKGLLFLASFALVFTFQLFAWKVQFDAFLVQPYGKGFIHYTHPRLFSFLFSTNHGLFLWHPFFLLAFLGLLFFASPYRPWEAITLFAQSYINSAARDWFGGAAFGQRRMISRLPLFAFGLTRLNKKRRLGLYSLLALLTLFNLLSLLQWKLGFIPSQGTLTLKQFLGGKIFLPYKLWHRFHR